MSGVLAEFDTADDLLAAVRAVLTVAKPDQVEAYSPHPLEELDDLLVLPRSPATRWGAIGGLTGMVTAAVGQWFVTAYDYPLNVGDRPLNPLPAYVPVVVELTILGVVVGSLAAFLWHCGLVRLWYPEAEWRGFERASQDRFFLRVVSEEAGIEAALRVGHPRAVTPC